MLCHQPRVVPISLASVKPWNRSGTQGEYIANHSMAELFCRPLASTPTSPSRCTERATRKAIFLASGSPRTATHSTGDSGGCHCTYAASVTHRRPLTGPICTLSPGPPPAGTPSGYGTDLVLLVAKVTPGGLVPSS